MRSGHLLFLSLGGRDGAVREFVVAVAGLTPVAVALNRGARLIDQDLLLDLGHKNHFAFRIFNLEPLKTF